MNKVLATVVAVCLLAVCCVAAFYVMDDSPDNGGPDNSGPGSSDSSSDSSNSSSSSSSSASSVSYGDAVSSVSGLTIELVEGTADAYELYYDSDTKEYTVVFTEVSEDTEYSVSGTLAGSIVVNAGDSYDFKLTLAGITVTSTVLPCIDFESADNATLTAKKDTSNYLYDKRSEVTDEDSVSSAVYATMDLDVQGNGSLTVVSDNNNGIHTKNDLDVKNLTLTVTCADNALKGNDSVTVQSGAITLTATEGDAVKTTDTDVSSKGNQRGIVTINTDKGDLALTIYSALDGIDAAYGVHIEETEGNTLTVSINTGAYSGTTSTTTAANITSAFNGGNGGPFGPGGGSDSGRTPGGDRGWDYEDSNSESRKGIKGDSYVEVLSGTITVMSSDDSVHSNGYVIISGGALTLTTGDDGVHADGALTVSGGSVTVLDCYEGLEGSTVTISGGDVSVTSDDDGVNSTATSGTGITVSGGTLYVNAGGDGLDSNTGTSYKGVVISGGYSVVISNGASDTALDTENGYTYTGGYLLGISQRGGFSSENTNCSNFSSIGKSANLSLSKGSYVSVTVGGKVVVSVEMPVSISSAIAVYLGSSSASISQTSSSSYSYDGNGVYWA